MWFTEYFIKMTVNKYPNSVILWTMVQAESQQTSQLCDLLNNGSNWLSANISAMWSTEHWFEQTVSKHPNSVILWTLVQAESQQTSQLCDILNTGSKWLSAHIVTLQSINLYAHSLLYFIHILCLLYRIVFLFMIQYQNAAVAIARCIVL